jgi:hypothetical protein
LLRCCCCRSSIIGGRFPTIDRIRSSTAEKRSHFCSRADASMSEKTWLQTILLKAPPLVRHLINPFDWLP